MKSAALVWFRRDLRLEDHPALTYALAHHEKVYPVFIFDTTLLAPLPRADRRVEFIHASLLELEAALQAKGGGLWVEIGDPIEVIPRLAQQLQADAVYTHHDDEPAAQKRDMTVKTALLAWGKTFSTFKDTVIFERNEVLSQKNTPFSVFTPYKKAWLKKLEQEGLPPAPPPFKGETLAQPASRVSTIPSLATLGFESTAILSLLPAGMSGAQKLLEDFLPKRLGYYHHMRDYPSVKGVSYLSVHLRFGTISIRQLVLEAWARRQDAATREGADSWLNELIWRDFYQMILFHFPHVVSGAFKPHYDAIEWETGAHADAQFAAWCTGKTGYPLVDAAMRQLNQTGYMHNRLRMLTASFLTKHLGIHWQRGEAYFAEKLNDFDLASNNGGWQWAASTGCDAQPYFRVFNPILQSQKFDAQGAFIRRYVPELAHVSDKMIHTPWLHQPRPVGYPAPIVEHAAAREQAIARFSKNTEKTEEKAFAK